MPDANEIFERLSRIEQILARMDERTKNFGDLSQDHENRLRTLEAKEARRSGVIAALTALGSAIGAALTWLAHHLLGGGG